MFAATRAALAARPGRAELTANLLAGLTVGIIAIPLSMALAIASGAPPQHGLYTAAIAGVVIALTAGSAVNVSGPTAAFVVVLLPVVEQFGLGGLLTAGLLAGAILVGLGLGRVGRLIEVVPHPVVAGFTAGIGVVIATLQIPDFLGLATGTLHGHYPETPRNWPRSSPPCPRPTGARPWWAQSPWRSCCCGPASTRPCRATWWRSSWPRRGRGSPASCGTASPWRRSAVATAGK
ncbi:MAG: hypothetical protein KatS3mg124_2242 [Porticoccaceae bacterium]|nr:MAG: hypothetical protein KatS3mg124_2242 [Porticoccaceae bacterium]